VGCVFIWLLFRNKILISNSVETKKDGKGILCVALAQVKKNQQAPFSYMPLLVSDLVLDDLAWVSQSSI
jgi:hypothetical protein